MTETPVALIAVLALGTVAAAVLAALLGRSHQRIRQCRAQVAALEAGLADRAEAHAGLTAKLRAAEAEVEYLVVRVQDAAVAVRASDVKVRPAAGEHVDPVLDKHLTAVLDQVQEVVAQEGQRVDFAAQAAVRGATTTMQALLYQLQTLLRQMQEKYDDPLVAEDLFAADFLNEQVLRRIQSTAVVCGAWPGLARGNSHLADVVVGAVSRLSGYERVQVSNQLRDPVGVVARAVEPVAIVLAELIGNALHYSHPELPVSVTLQQGNRGASVIVDDAGVGMNEDEMAGVRRLLSGGKQIMITELGDPPRNGFAAIARLVQQYGFPAHVETSPYGGVRAVVHIPGETLLTLMDEEESPQSAMAPLPAAGARSFAGRPGAGAAAGAVAGVPGEVPGGISVGGAPPAGGAPTVGSDPAVPPVRRNAGHRAVAEQTGEEPADGSPVGPADEIELPRRRNKRGGSDSVEQAGAGHAARTAGGGERPVSDTMSPEASAERWLAFQRGTASGRAAVDETQPPARGAAEAGTDPAEDGDLAPPDGSRTGTGTGAGTGTGTGRTDDRDRSADARAAEGNPHA